MQAYGALLVVVVVVIALLMYAWSAIAGAFAFVG